MKTIVLLFVAAVLSFTGLAIRDKRVRAAALERAYANREREALEQRRIPDATPEQTLRGPDASLLGLSADQVRLKLGEPRSIEGDHFGIVVWTYPYRVIEFNHRGQVDDVIPLGSSGR